MCGLRRREGLIDAPVRLRVYPGAVPRNPRRLPSQIAHGPEEHSPVVSAQGGNEWWATVAERRDEEHSCDVAVVTSVRAHLLPAGDSRELAELHPATIVAAAEHAHL